jgi:hypothetical protein
MRTGLKISEINGCISCSKGRIKTVKFGRNPVGFVVSGYNAPHTSLRYNLNFKSELLEEMKELRDDF